MSNPESYFPPETFDAIIDFLHGQPKTLRNSCLVSKSWVPRTRKHLFADINFRSPFHLDAWKRTFPDPATSPAYHTRSLSVRCTGPVTTADAEEGGWIRTFSNIVRLELWNNTLASGESRCPFVPFHHFLLEVKSLRVVSLRISPSQVLSLAHSFPLLEDLTMMNYGPLDTDDWDKGISRPLVSPLLTGTLCIYQYLKYVVRQLLDRPGGLYFRKFICKGCLEEDLEAVTALVQRCSNTLEHIDIDCQIHENLSSVSVDLSRAKKLKEISFSFNWRNPTWVTTALRTIAPNNEDLRHVLIHIPPRSPSDYDRIVKTEGTCSKWMELDHALNKLWELQEIRTKIMYTGQWKEEAWGALRVMLPEIMKRG